MTRCIGDRRLRHLGLSSEPELRCCARAPTDVGIVLVDAEYVFMYPNQRPRGHVFRCNQLYSAIFTVFFSVVFPRSSEYAAQYCLPALRLAYSARRVVLASDGLWDVMDEARVLHCLTHTARSADMLAKRLVLEAMDRGTTDNVTCAVVLF